jgi:hypothetical protein
VDRLFAETLARIRQIPGVEAAGAALGLPYTRLLNLGFKPLDGGVDVSRGNITNLSYITPGYIEALRIPVRSGRSFTESDAATAPGVAIVNEEFARRYYKGQTVVGRRIVRAAGSIEDVTKGLHQAVAAVDPMLPLAKVESMSDVQAASLASQRFMMTLVVGLGAVALLLAAIGIHGLIASSVSERTRELGIRLALGATSAQVMRNVVLPGITLAAAGIVVGGAGAFAVVRLMQSFLWGVTPTDPMTFIAVVVMLLAVALFASVIPALRVLRLDPAMTLRAE